MFAATSSGVPSFGDQAWHAPVRCFTSGALLANTLAPAAGISPGQTLTANANGALSADPAFHGAGFVVGSRILVTSEAAPKNGIYTIVALGDGTHPWQLVRATDANTASAMPIGSMVLDLAFGALWFSGTAGAAWPACAPSAILVPSGSTTTVPLQIANGLLVVNGPGGTSGFALRQVVANAATFDDGAGGALAGILAPGWRNLHATVAQVAQVTANQGSITALVDLTGLSVTITAVAGHRYRVTGYATFSSTVAGDSAGFYIREGSTQLQGANIPLPLANAAYSEIVTVVLSPSAGAHTYKLSAQRVNATGTLTMAAAATQPAQIVVEDLG